MKKSNVTAVIEIGSTGIRLVIARIGGQPDVEILDRAGKPSRIGRDVFTLGHITREAMRESLAVLSSFKELLSGYDILPEDARVFATSAIREASNRDTFVDRVSLQTGFRITVVEDIEENHLMYLAVQHALQDGQKLLSRSNAMILEVGGGSTEIMLLRRGRMVASHSLSIGTVRVGEHMKAAGSSPAYLRQFLEDNVRTTCDCLEEDMVLESVRTFIVIGSDARLAASRLAGNKTEHYSVIPRESFCSFADSTSKLSTEECVAEFRISWSDAEGLVSGLAIEKHFLERTQAENVVIPDVSIREGLLLAILKGPDNELAYEMHRQILASTSALGRKFHFDETHAKTVTGYALAIFDALVKDYGLDRKARLLLETSSMLHDIGTMVRYSGHHKHGEYIISNSEIFGLNRKDLGIISNVVRYHRKMPPAPTHLNFIALPREDRILVTKLAAILRVADALDRGHNGKIGKLEFERIEDRFIIKAENRHDFSLERLSMTEKSDMFAEVFGLEPVLA
ncbi:MAG: HD domain-containing protein [Rectinemataceae bacterium]|nr:HD domain-containing protein [Rectinemataceae bacterium]